MDIEELDTTAGFTRRYDLKVEKTDGTIVRYELKAWAPDNIEKFLGCAFKKSERRCTETNEYKEFYGQMHRDLVKMFRETSSNIKVIWMFDSRSKEQLIQIKSLALRELDKNLGELAISARVELNNDIAARQFKDTMVRMLSGIFEIGEY
ncbi:hypothetical protein [Algibacillus agarilyticus]|uniref:hypothetical protein n=1 Tax=Algibacillus agarilyticus TaxID=2234133 RepID=UPI000DD0AE52|nr:hypothetical protein [Algibacillus agarilyticus]